MSTATVTTVPSNNFLGDIVTLIIIGLILVPVLAWSDVFQEFFIRLFGVKSTSSMLWYAIIITLIVAIIIWLIRAATQPKRVVVTTA